MSGQKIPSCLACLMTAMLVVACGERGIAPASLQPASQVSTPVGGGSGRMAYTSYHDKHYAICVMNADGSQPTRLTWSAGDDFFPAWSPDGQEIAFASKGMGFLQIYVMNADGSQPTRLTYTQADQLAPAWSPDGKKIAFVSYRDGGDEEIYLMNADGSEQIRLTHNPGEDGDPAWEP
jgi:Tol biopolymer transport system component